MILSLLFFIHSLAASFHAGAVMPDGKVDKLVEAPGNWHAPVYGVELFVDFAPDWQALQEWNDATIGVSLGYWNLNHNKMGHAITPYIYMDIPLVRRPHFELGLRPGIGTAFVTKTYRNTVLDGHMFVDVQGANQSIGSVCNLYFPEVIYMRFPIARGWGISLAGGWYHISNGSTRQPNSGYNIFAAELGVKKDVNFTPQSLSKVSRNTSENSNIFSSEFASGSRKWSVALSGTISGRQVYYRDQQTFLVSSIHASMYWHAHSIFRLGGGLDAFYDGAYVRRETHFAKTNLSLAEPGDCWRVGVSVQPEFVVGKFTAGLHIGAYMYDPVKALEPQWKKDGLPQERLDKPIFYAYDLLNAGSAGYPDGWLYSEVVLRYHLPWHIFVQAMMKSHLTKVEFVSLGIGLWY